MKTNLLENSWIVLFLKTTTLPQRFFSVSYQSNEMLMKDISIFSIECKVDSFSDNPPPPLLGNHSDHSEKMFKEFEEYMSNILFICFSVMQIFQIWDSVMKICINFVFISTFSNFSVWFSALHKFLVCAALCTMQHIFRTNSNLHKSSWQGCQMTHEIFVYKLFLRRKKDFKDLYRIRKFIRKLHNISPQFLVDFFCPPSQLFRISKKIDGKKLNFYDYWWNAPNKEFYLDINKIFQGEKPEILKIRTLCVRSPISI